MNKIISLLGSFGLTASIGSVTLTITACSTEEKDKNNNNNDGNNNDGNNNGNGNDEEWENDDDETNKDKNILVGYWYLWGGANQVQPRLVDVDKSYNVINVSFLYAQQPYFMPTFDTWSPETKKNIIEDIKKLHGENRKVLISMGGQTGEGMRFREDQKEELKQTFRNVIDEFNFDGVDIDWEGSVLSDRTSQHVTSAALIDLKQEYKEKGKHLYITMAPELPYLKNATESSGGSYIPFFKDLEKYYDWINPQFYNGWAFGPYVEAEEANIIGVQPQSIISNDDYARRAEFYYLMTKYLTVKYSPLNGFYLIDPSRFVIGMSTNEPAGRGATYKEAVFKTKKLLDNDKIKVKGLMTWAINFDAFEGPLTGTSNNIIWTKWSFARWYDESFGL